MTLNSQIADLDNHFYPDAHTFFPWQAPTALTYDEVSLKTCRTWILPNDTDPTTLLTEKIKLSTPIISSDMDTVTESAMAIQMALNWWMWMIHSNLPIEEQLKHIGKVKHHIHGIIRNPIAIGKTWDISSILRLIEQNKYSFGTFPVLDESNKLIGLLGWKSVKDRFADKMVTDVMKPLWELKTLSEDQLWKDPIKTADQFFTNNRWIDKLLILGKNGELNWLITESDIARIKKEKTSNIKPTRDSDHRLMVWSTLHIVRKENWELDRSRIIENVSKLQKKWVDLVAVSTAHGLSDSVWEMLKLVRSEFPDLDIMAGNITSAEGVEFLQNAGANIIKVWQWPGSICTTREQTGVWVPQMTALYVCSEAARILWSKVKILADGWITAPWAMVKALTLWDAVMVWSLVAWSDEAPWELREFNWVWYKEYRWMWSIAAMEKGSAARYGQNTIDSWRKLSAEWIESMKKAIGPVSPIIQWYRASIQSGMWYLWAKNTKELKKNARYAKLSPAGQKESRPHIREL